MPLRSNTSLAWNLPGIVAYYQPVRAPGPLLARYNMAHGGDSAYRLVPAGGQTLPAWSPVSGWTFSRSAENVGNTFASGLTWTNPSQVETVILRLTMGATNNNSPFGSISSGPTYVQFCIQNRWYGGTVTVFCQSYTLNHVSAITSGVCAISGGIAYVDGVTAGSIGTVPLNFSGPIGIGGLFQGPDVRWAFVGTISAFLYSPRTLSAAEVWSVSRQMQYCDVNPDWSVWGRRRQWFYGPQVGGFQAAWARNANSVLQVGRQ